MKKEKIFCNVVIGRRDSLTTNLIRHMKTIYEDIWKVKNTTKNSDYSELNQSRFMKLLTSLIIQYRLPFAILSNSDFIELSISKI